MAPTWVPSLCMLALLGQAPVTGSHLYQPSFEMEEGLRKPVVPYVPQAGDIFLSSDNGFFIRLGHSIAGAGEGPHHSGIVVAMRNGEYAILEGGPHNTIYVGLRELLTNLRSYETKSCQVWIRRRSVPLHKEQSDALTTWAMSENGKPFAAFRMLSQMTPFRCRGTLRTDYLGKPNGQRFSYFCSELVMESCVAAKALDPSRCRPAATYPCDLFSGRSVVPFIDRNLDINASWHPPARWTSNP